MRVAAAVVVGTYELRESLVKFTPHAITGPDVDVLAPILNSHLRKLVELNELTILQNPVAPGRQEILAPPLGPKV
jgi:hypothetical protein